MDNIHDKLSERVFEVECEVRKGVLATGGDEGFLHHYIEIEFETGDYIFLTSPTGSSEGWVVDEWEPEQIW